MIKFSRKSNTSSQCTQSRSKYTTVRHSRTYFIHFSFSLCVCVCMCVCISQCLRLYILPSFPLSVGLSLFFLLTISNALMSFSTFFSSEFVFNIGILVIFVSKTRNANSFRLDALYVNFTL